MKAIVDKNTCIGCGLCAGICPEIYTMDEDGKSVASDEVIPDALEGEATDAMHQCPVDAISMSEQKGAENKSDVAQAKDWVDNGSHL